MQAVLVTLAKKNGKEEYFVFLGSKYLKYKEDDSFRTYPWVIEEFEKSRDKSGEFEEVLVTHSCGLFEVELDGIWLKNFGDNLQNINLGKTIAYYPGGEFCNIAHLISYRPKLLKVKLWKGEILHFGLLGNKILR